MLSMTKEEYTKEEYTDTLEKMEAIYYNGDNSYSALKYFKKSMEKIYKLINEHFNNSCNFKHFKLHSDSTLKSLKKDELIDYIHILYENWGSADSFNENLSNYNQILTSELKKFDNPPLKFEDLHDKMWIWDNKYKQYIKLRIINNILYYGNDEEYRFCDYIEFEENRFYRYEVKDVD